ncbi:structure-specific recognition protein-domain-containing protein [Gymnopilus junonius]|uniref:FACT complex subunit POB3 n=1 Tax=Gymnopilus junonius TaxID=109634 RepID=A0A9P5TJK6_GYMJU|nr:structure-specific recognition protein-domain-containing protein [Gymnopilus junonius]
MAATQFDRIYHGMSIDTGKFRVAASGMAWKADSEGNKEVTAIQSENIKWVQWLRVARGFQLRVGLKDHKREKFDGFAREDHDKLTTLMKNYFGVTLETIEVSFKGWNWGVADFHGEDLAFMVSDKTSFELPLRHVANSNIAGKTEVSLEFSNLTAPSKSGGSRQVGDELTEIRFFVPGTIAKLKGSDQGSDKSDNEEEDGQEEISAAQVFHDTIKEKADIGAGIGDLILSFDEVLVLTPRGRYDMDMFPDFLRLRGKTYDYKVLYQSIARLFLLPKDDQQVLFILGLSTPIRQGQTLYQYLVMQFTREEEITAELNMTDEEMEKYDKLKKNYEAPTYEVVSSVFRALSGKKIIGSGSFQSRDGHPGFKANLKAVQGDLFMLERYIFFVSKSPLLIELSDIHQVIFSRVGSTAAATGGRTFDIKIMLKSGGEYMFTSINKEEHEVTEAYLKDKKIRVKNEMVPDADLLLKAVGVDDDDEDMQSVVSDDDDDRGKRQKKPVRAGGGDDESEEEDEDFKASDSDSGSPSGSDSDTSGAETASDASGDLALTKDAKSKGKSKAKDKDGDGAHKKAVKKKPAVKKGSDAGDDDEDKKDKPKAKPKPKPKPKAKKASDDEAMDVDGEEKPKPKPKPKAVGASSSKPKPKGDEPMDVDEVKEKPKPKPKPKKKDAETDAEPPKKKLKKIDD